MMDNEEKLDRYRKNITHKEVTDAFKCYYETKDMKVRENLIYRYMPTVKEAILKYRKLGDEEEDLIQTAYEILINSIDNYNPYENVAFSIYLHAKIRNKMENRNKNKKLV